MFTVDSKSPNANKSLFLLAGSLLGGCILIYLFVIYLGFPKRVGTIAFATLDINVYFKSSDWVVGGGRLYRDVLSEYPPLANLIFGGIRALSERIRIVPDAFDNFIWLWMTISWIIYIGIGWQLYIQKNTRKYIWLLATPAVLYYTLYRYDIYPALFTFVALHAIKNSKFHLGSFWLGVAIAVKGYALFLLPIYYIYVYRKKSISFTIKTCLITLIPFIFTHVIIFFISGVDGVIAPYLFHAVRGLNGESTYDVFIHFSNIRSLEIISDYPQVTRVLQCLGPLLILLIPPQKFEDLVFAFLFIVIWFISFSIFYSPQFILWIFPLLCFVKSPQLFYLSLPFSILTFIYYPLSRGSVISMYDPLLPITLMRFAMIYICFRQLWMNRGDLKLYKPPTIKA